MKLGVQTSVIGAPTDWVMDWFQPAIDGAPTTWRGRIDDLRRQGILHAEAERLTRPFAWRSDVVLDSRGWVVEGADIVIAAYMKGIRKVPVVFVLEDNS